VTCVHMTSSLGSRGDDDPSASEAYEVTNWLVVAVQSGGMPPIRAGRCDVCAGFAMLQRHVVYAMGEDWGDLGRSEPTDLTMIYGSRTCDEKITVVFLMVSCFMRRQPARQGIRLQYLLSKCRLFMLAG
jgi:hypothetical protein